MDELLNQSIVEQISTTLNAWIMTVDIAPLDLAMTAGLVVSWVALIFSLVAMKRIKKQSATTYRLYEKIVHDLHIASSGAIGMGQRIMALERRMTGKQTDFPKPAEQPHLQAVPKQEKPEIKKPPAELLPEDPFDLAKHLLRRGIDQTEVARRCGLSSSETALMAMVLNNRQGQSPRLAS